MTLTYYDKREIIDAVERAERKAAEAVKAVTAGGDKTQKQMVEAFNRVAEALEKLTAEVAGLRADISPTLDKPAKKLAAPAKNP